MSALRRWRKKIITLGLLAVMAFAAMIIAGFANFWCLYFFLLLVAYAQGG